MNMITLLESIRDAVLYDSTTQAWSEVNFSREHTVLIGVDQRKPPTDDQYPLVHIYPLQKSAGYEHDTTSHLVGVNCGVHIKGLETDTPEDNYSEMTGITMIEEFRKHVETAITSATLSVRVDAVRIEYETIEYYPYFLAAMEFKLTGDNYQGGDPFA